MPILSDDKQDCNPKELLKLERKKMDTLKLAEVFKGAGLETQALRIADCGTWIQYARHVQTGERKLLQGNFCKIRLCPLCEWRRAVSYFVKLSRALNYIDEKHGEQQLIFLTLTMKNCEAGELKNSVRHLLKSFDRLIRQRPITRAFSGYFRAFELTRNSTTGEYHPHLHVMLLAPPEYKPSSTLYITHEKIITAWKKALGVDYQPSVRIERVKDRSGGVCEVAKYSVKGSDILKGSKSRQVQTLEEIWVAVAGVRMIGTGGILREALRILKIDMEDMKTEKEDIRSDISWVLESWRFGASGYRLDKK